MIKVKYCENMNQYRASVSATLVGFGDSPALAMNSLLAKITSEIIDLEKVKVEVIKQMEKAIYDSKEEK